MCSDGVCEHNRRQTGTTARSGIRRKMALVIREVFIWCKKFALKPQTIYQSATETWEPAIEKRTIRGSDTNVLSVSEERFKSVVVKL